MRFVLEVDDGEYSVKLDRDDLEDIYSCMEATHAAPGWCAHQIMSGIHAMNAPAGN
jgi:hypothetical protein